VDVSVGDDRHMPRRFEERVGVLLGEVFQVGDGRVLLQDHLAVPVGEDLQGVLLADAEGAADLLWNDDASQIVDAANHSRGLQAVSTSRAKVFAWAEALMSGSQRQRPQELAWGRAKSLPNRRRWTGAGSTGDHRGGTASGPDRQHQRGRPGRPPD